MNAGPVVDDRVSPTAAAPHLAARPASEAARGARAAVAFVACVAAAGWLAAYAWRHRPLAAELDAAPYALDDAAWRSVRAIASPSSRSCPRAVSVVILYVTRSCVHCRAELARWSSLVRAKSAALRCTALAVVTAPDQAAAPAHWLPAELVPALLLDHDGVVARALNVRLVPLAAYVTGVGVVIAKVVGETSVEATTRRLADLDRIALAGTGDR